MELVVFGNLNCYAAALMQNTREKTEGSNFGLVCFAFDLLNKFKFTVNLSKLGNSSQKHY